MAFESLPANVQPDSEPDTHEVRVHEANGNPLPPIPPRLARRVIRDGYASVKAYAPPTIQLTRRMPLFLLRHYIYERDGWRCQYCGGGDPPKHRPVANPLTLDHIVPRAAGGLGHADNLITACRRCNRLKEDKTLSDFLANRPETLRRIQTQLVQPLGKPNPDPTGEQPCTPQPTNQATSSPARTTSSFANCTASWPTDRNEPSCP